MYTDKAGPKLARHPLSDEAAGPVTWDVCMRKKLDAQEMSGQRAFGFEAFFHNAFAS